MNAWLRHVPAALDPELEDGWLELLGGRDAADHENGARQVEAGPGSRPGSDDAPVVPLPRMPVRQPSRTHTGSSP